MPLFLKRTPSRGAPTALDAIIAEMKEISVQLRSGVDSAAVDGSLRTIEKLVAIFQAKCPSEERVRQVRERQLADRITLFKTVVVDVFCPVLRPADPRSPFKSPYETLSADLEWRLRNISGRGIDPISFVIDGLNNDLARFRRARSLLQDSLDDQKGKGKV